MALPVRRNSARRRAVPAHPPKHAAAAVRAPANPRRSTAVIDFKAVEKRYDVGAIGLDQASFSVQRGEFVFLVGSTGSGKSTIMRLLIKELEPSGGRIAVAGRDLAEITRRRVPYYRRNIGVVFQDFKLLPNRTVYDNVAYALQVTGGSRKEIRAKVPDILRLTGLSTKLHNYPDQLSGGEQQRVAIARAFVNHPPLLLADEPTGNLDPETSIGIMQLLYRINKTGTTVLVGHPRPPHGRQDAPPRDRALQRPDRARRGDRPLRQRRVDARVRRAPAQRRPGRAGDDGGRGRPHDAAQHRRARRRGRAGRRRRGGRPRRAHRPPRRA